MRQMCSEQQRKMRNEEQSIWQKNAIYQIVHASLMFTFEVDSLVLQH